MDLLGDEADLTVLLDGQVTYLRTVRLPGDPLSESEAEQALLTEIRRTMAAAQNVLGGAHGGIDRAVRQRAGPGSARPLDVRLAAGAHGDLRSLCGLAAWAAVARAFPDRPGRFSPLLGMLLDEADRTPHAIDFLHPRQRPPPRSRRKQLVMASLAVALLVALVVLYQNWAKGRLEDEIESLTRKSKALDSKVAKADKVNQEVADISKWTAVRSSGSTTPPIVRRLPPSRGRHAHRS